MSVGTTMRSANVRFTPMGAAFVARYFPPGSDSPTLGAGANWVMAWAVEAMGDAMASAWRSTPPVLRLALVSLAGDPPPGGGPAPESLTAAALSEALHAWVQQPGHRLALGLTEDLCAGLSIRRLSDIQALALWSWACAYWSAMSTSMPVADYCLADPVTSLLSSVAPSGE